MRRLVAVTWVAISLVCPAFAFGQEGLSPEMRDLMAKAIAGDAVAQFRVAAAYDWGNGAPRDSKEAMKWYRASAEQGYAEAQNSIGSSLQEQKRYAEAMQWYEKAAAQGHAHATNNLAYLYDMGYGVAQDRKRGFELYSKAADLGWAEAMWNLTLMNGAGQVGKPDILMACVWAVRAKRFAQPGERQLASYVARAIPQIERELTADQVAACKQQGESWSPPLKAANAQ